jgi:hypothetical protein
METLILIFLVIALVCFVVAALGKWTFKTNLIALGLAFWVATLLLPHLK